MIVARVPYRISFFGGGTDYPKWYLQEGGSVLSATIDKYCTLSCRYLPPFFLPARHRVVWSHIENVSSIDEILHPAVREGLKMMGYTDERGLEIHHLGDLPARAGMGSSSAFANALILALSRLNGRPLARPALYRMAMELEQDRLNDCVGSQDQVATAVGGLNVIDFNADHSIDVARVEISPTRRRMLENNLVLFYLGTSRFASSVALKVVENIDRRAGVLREMKQLVSQAATLLRSPNADLDDFGRLLDHTWRLKKSISDSISTDRVDEVYASAMAAGALGGKLLGAGVTGFMVFYVRPQQRQAVMRALDGILQVPFRFEERGAHVWFDGTEHAGVVSEDVMAEAV